MHVGARGALELRKTIKTAITFAFFYIILSNLRYWFILMLPLIWYCQTSMKARACTWTWRIVKKLTNFCDYMSFSDLSKISIDSRACAWAGIWLNENLNPCNCFIFQGNKLKFRMLTNISNHYDMLMPKITSARVCTCIKLWLADTKMSILLYIWHCNRCLTCW